MYKDNPVYTVKTFSSRDEWLEARKRGIGGSDAASFVGPDVKPFKNLLQIWQDKKGLSKPQLDNEAMAYGRDMEPLMRDMFAIDHPDMIVLHKEDCMLVSREDPHRFYSPDGLILHGDRKGVYECKTYRRRTSAQYEKDWGIQWNSLEHSIPDKYFCQILHGLLVTGFDFVVVHCLVTHSDGHHEIIERWFDREEVEDDLEELKRIEDEKWEKYFVADVKPPLEVF